MDNPVENFGMNSGWIVNKQPCFKKGGFIHKLLNRFKVLYPQTYA
jgi:hypothetical protein